MGYEFKINKELASLSNTASEWLSIAEVVNGQIPSGPFHDQFNQMIKELSGCYELMVKNLRQLAELDSEAAFVNGFDGLLEAYRGYYLQEASKPRPFADEAYEIFLDLSLTKEFNTSYPLLHRTFYRLTEFVDKWVTNDAWIVMSSDIVFKTMLRFLQEIETLKKQDSEDAFIVFQSAMNRFLSYADLIDNLKASIDRVCE